jgi:hypothetical protein
MHTEFLCGKLYINVQIKDQEYNGRITLRWILVRWVFRIGVDGTGSRSCPREGLDINCVELPGVSIPECAAQTILVTHDSAIMTSSLRRA